MDRKDSNRARAHQQLDFIIDSGCRSLSETTIKMIAATAKIVRIKLRRQQRERRRKRTD